jgi:alkylhydroperoxidase/carboxymuconolactone decarboxylase family protein YurZ
VLIGRLQIHLVTRHLQRGGEINARKYYPSLTQELAQKRRELILDQAFSRKIFADGARPLKMKQIIAVAVAHVTQCLYCIKGHTGRRCGMAPRSRN